MTDGSLHNPNWLGSLSMQTNFILTLTGPDRIGIVGEVTGLLFQRGGNVETSRMARLGGEFAVLMLVSMPTEQFAGLEEGLGSLTAQGYKVTTTLAEGTYAEAHIGWLPYRVEVEGADHEGIIHEVARYLSSRGISIESADSESTPAPTSGSPLFAMTARVVVPPGLSGTDWEAGLEEIGGRLNLDIKVSPWQDE
jgi:glycine cleavage system transcriptional repressor